MSLPSNVGVDGSIPLVQFDILERYHATPPASPRLTAWIRLDEVERRLNHFDWIALYVDNRRGNTQFVSDLANSYLHSFEATLQAIRTDLKSVGIKGGLNDWLVTQPQYDLLVRGLRMLRHFDAHIRGNALASGQGYGAFTRFHSGTRTHHHVSWRLPSVSNAEYNALNSHGRTLLLSDLPAWNTLVEENFASNLLKTGLERLANLVATAESAVTEKLKNRG